MKIEVEWILIDCVTGIYLVQLQIGDFLQSLVEEYCLFFRVIVSFVHSHQIFVYSSILTFDITEKFFPYYSEVPELFDYLYLKGSFIYLEA